MKLNARTRPTNQTNELKFYHLSIVFTITFITFLSNGHHIQFSLFINREGGSLLFKFVPRVILELKPGLYKVYEIGCHKINFLILLYVYSTGMS